uniref:Uncharacterized protein n=1 Tax=Arundo donax TaxID=35708 RepID=A0A0A9G1A8_ARUDO
MSILLNVGKQLLILLRRPWAFFRPIFSQHGDRPMEVV